MKTRTLTALPAMALLLTSLTATADQKITIGAKLLGASWAGDNGSIGSSYESSDGSQFGFNVTYVANRLYAGLNLQTGEYSFSQGSPDQFTTTGRVAANDTTIRQNDFDLLVGYFFWPRVSLFMDVKAVGNVWSTNDYEQHFSGLGLGVSGYTPINEQWTLFGTFGFIANGDIKNEDDNKVGEGHSRAVEFGAVFALDEVNHMNMGIKLRKYAFEHVDNSTQDYDVNALFIGFTHTFTLN